MSDELIMTFCGTIGALFGSFVSLIIWMLDNKKQRVRNRKKSLAIIYQALANIKEKTDYNNYQKPYHTIYESESAIIAFQNRLISFRLLYPHIPSEIINYLNKLEKIIDNSIDEINYKKNDDLFLLVNFGQGKYDELNEVKNDLIKSIDHQISRRFWLILPC